MIRRRASRAIFLQAQLVRLPDEGAVLFRIHVLDVHQAGVQKRQRAGDHVLIRRECSGLDGGVQPLVLRRRQKGDGEFRLAEAFPAGEGHTAARIAVIIAVLYDLAHDLVDGHVPPDGLWHAVHRHGLDAVLLHFGVTAPAAAEAAALEEHDRADAGAVMDGIALDVRDAAARVSDALFHRSSRPRQKPACSVRRMMSSCSERERVVNSALYPATRTTRER